MGQVWEGNEDGEADTQKEHQEKREQPLGTAQTQPKRQASAKAPALRRLRLPSWPPPAAHLEAPVSHLLTPGGRTWTSAACEVQGRAKGKRGQGCFPSPSNSVSIWYLNQHSVSAAPL